MPHDHILVDDDNRFIIDGATRQVTNLTGTKPSVMQLDHNSEKLVFQMPRYVDGHDMLLCDAVKILYKNTGKGTSASNRPVLADVETITDIAVDESDDSMVTFSWTIPEFATVYVGTLVFQFKFVCYGETEESLHEFVWHTEQYSFIEVRPSLDTDVSTEVETKYPNILTEIEARLQAYNKELADVKDDIAKLGHSIEVVESTGDTTDRLAEIQALLDNNGYAKLGKGEFYLSGQLRIRNGATLDGCGKATVIKQTPDSTQSSMIWLQSEGTIRNVCLQGEWTAKPTNETAYTSRRIGIVITGGTNNAIIDGCWFIGWTGQAILASTNSAATRSFLMSNCDVRWNNVGLKTAESEYACIANCTFRENITGVLNNGGNNKFVCCGFDSNYDGFVINEGYNNGHGSCNGCTFNHNTHYAVNMAYTELGFVFSGCNFAEGTIRNTKSKGIMFSGCRFGNWLKYNNYTENVTLFSGCIFSHSPQTESSEWLDAYGGYKFTGCFNYNTGESVDNIPVAAPETWTFTLEDGSTITKDVMLDV